MTRVTPWLLFVFFFFFSKKQKYFLSIVSFNVMNLSLILSLLSFIFHLCE